MLADISAGFILGPLFIQIYHPFLVLSEHLNGWVAKSKNKSDSFLDKYLPACLKLFATSDPLFKKNKMYFYQAWRT